MRAAASRPAGEFWAEVGRDWLKTRRRMRRCGSRRSSSIRTMTGARQAQRHRPGPARAGSGAADRRSGRFATPIRLRRTAAGLRQLLRRRARRATPSPPTARRPRRCRTGCAGRGSRSSTSPNAAGLGATEPALDFTHLRRRGAGRRLRRRFRRTPDRRGGGRCRTGWSACSASGPAARSPNRASPIPGWRAYADWIAATIAAN